MKGVFIHNQLEYRVESEKDSLSQGDGLLCRLSIKNHGSATEVLDDIFLELAYGDHKSGKDSRFEILETAAIKQPWQLPPQEQQSQEFRFSLGSNFPISDKSKSPLLRFGAVSRSSGIAPITVEPHPVIRSVETTLQSLFQFVLKGQKSSKQWIEAKFKPSSAKKFNLVDELTLRSQFDGTDLVLQFVFKVKKVEAQSMAFSVKKDKVQVDKRLEERAYMLDGFLNHQAVDSVLEEALETVASNF